MAAKKKKVAKRPAKKKAVKAAKANKGKKTRKKAVKVAFGLSSSEPNSHFVCKLDNAVFKPCAPSSSWSFKLGKHAVTAKAIDSVGNEGALVTYRFKVVKAHGKKHHKGHEKKKK